MKKIIIYFCFLFFPFFAISQFNTSVDFIVSVDYTNVSTSFGTTEERGLNFRVGGNFNFRVFDKVTMKTGIRFAQLGSTLKMDDLRWPSEFGPSGWMPDPALPRYRHISTIKRYIEVPLIGRFEFGHKKFSYYLEFGISPHLFLKTKVTKTSNLGSEIVINNNTINIEKRILMGYVIGLGFNYKLSEKLQLFAQPTMRMYSNSAPSTTSVAGFTSRYISFGLEFGIRRGLSFVQTDNKINI